MCVRITLCPSAGKKVFPSGTSADQQVAASEQLHEMETEVAKRGMRILGIFQQDLANGAMAQANAVGFIKPDMVPVSGRKSEWRRRKRERTQDE